MSAAPEHSPEAATWPPIALVPNIEPQSPNAADLSERFKKFGWGFIHAYDQEVGRPIEVPNTHTFNRELWQTYGRVALKSLEIGALLSDFERPTAIIVEKDNHPSFAVHLARVLVANEEESLTVRELAQLIDPDNPERAGMRIYNTFYASKNLQLTLAQEGFTLDISKVQKNGLRQANAYRALKREEGVTSQNIESEEPQPLQEPEPQDDPEPALLIQNETEEVPHPFSRYRFMWEDGLKGKTEEVVTRLAESIDPQDIKNARIPIKEGPILKKMVEQGIVSAEQARRGELDVTQTVKAILLGTTDGKKLILGWETKNAALRCIDDWVSYFIKTTNAKNAKIKF